MRTLIVHAGTGKTGSSALQVFLARNHTALRECSFDYFRLSDFELGYAGKISSGNGVAIALSLLPEGDPAEIETPAAHLEALNRAICESPCETGIISSEYFVHCDPGRLKIWAAGLDAIGCQVRVMYFIREQVQLLSSLYIQDIKRGQGRETPEAFVGRLYREIGHLKYASYYQSRCQIFGKKNVICETYESALAEKGGVCAAFLTAIGAEPAGLLIETGTVNAGLGAAELSIMRELNKFRPHFRVSDHLVDNARLTGRAHGSETYGFLPSALRHDIETYFAAENAAMARMYFGRDVLFPVTPQSSASSTVGGFSQMDVVNVLGGLLVRYDERIAQLEAQLAAMRAKPGGA